MRFNFTYWGLVAFAALLLFVLADYPFVGQLMVGVYALVAFWKFESSQVFKLAMVALAIMLVTLVAGLGQAAYAFAAYAFLLFMVGVFVLVRELWHFSKDLRKQKGEE